MPRKYRPPAARRRKSKRQAPYYVEPAPEAAPVAADDGASPSLPEDTEDAPVAVAAAPEPAPVQHRPAERTTAASAKHIARDYSYVRAEVRRIALIAGFLIVALIITALLRN